MGCGLKCKEDRENVKEDDEQEVAAEEQVGEEEVEEEEAVAEGKGGREREDFIEREGEAVIMMMTG